MVHGYEYYRFYMRHVRETGNRTNWVRIAYDGLNARIHQSRHCKTTRGHFEETRTEDLSERSGF